MGSTAFMGWDGPILTDSGGYQVFSLAETRRISEEGVEFASVYDGSRARLHPELTTRVQEDLGSDVAMVLDECPPADADREYHEDSLRRTARWAARCKEAHGKERSGALRDRAGWVVPRPEGGEPRAHGGDRVRRLRCGGALGRRVARGDARDAGHHGADAARREAEVLHGDRGPRRHPAGHSARGRHVRLRAPDAPRPPRRGPHPRWPAQPQEREVPHGLRALWTPSAPARRAPATAGPISLIS